MSLSVKSFIMYFDFKYMCTLRTHILRINCYLETRFRSLGVCKCKVLREKNYFIIFGMKIDQTIWMDFESF